MPKVIAAEDSTDDIARNLWRTARLIRPSHPARKRWDLLMFTFVISLPLALQALELRLD